MISFVIFSLRDTSSLEWSGLCSSVKVELENFFAQKQKQTAPLLPNCHFIVSFSTLSNPSVRKKNPTSGSVLFCLEACATQPSGSKPSQALFADLWRNAISFLTSVWGRGVDSTRFVCWQLGASSYMFNFWHSWETLQNILSVHTVNSMTSKHPGHSLLKDSQLSGFCSKKAFLFTYIKKKYYIFISNLHL